MLNKEDLIDVFKKVEDPELHIDVWTLGLIYKYDVIDNIVSITMTFTSPFCPYGPQLMEDLEEKLKEKGAVDVKIEITFDPPWQPSEELREMMGL
ncbi:aromatic ring hydroxylase [Candidatus Woesearchaeota archaeon CG10_big_fil_rev_8_21_14_0_10_45_16]|nr:MAG: aromatic ring hydroxylase [Candidatus Woesearchaeota archaeon CG10_big_fil_rev_8_21_14_0_10_45_16]